MHNAMSKSKNVCYACFSMCLKCFKHSIAVDHLNCVRFVRSDDGLRTFISRSVGFAVALTARVMMARIDSAGLVALVLLSTDKQGL
jgi:hypothetical protein